MKSFTESMQHLHNIWKIIDVANLTAPMVDLQTEWKPNSFHRRLVEDETAYYRDPRNRVCFCTGPPLPDLCRCKWERKHYGIRVASKLVIVEGKAPEPLS